MQKRYNILAEAGVRGLDEYNRWLVSAPADPETGAKSPKLPYIVVVIDELADLMMTVRREFEELVVRLAQMSACCGNPSCSGHSASLGGCRDRPHQGDFPARIAFQVAARPDSRTIIDGLALRRS